LAKLDEMKVGAQRGRRRLDVFVYNDKTIDALLALYLAVCEAVKSNAFASARYISKHRADLIPSIFLQEVGDYLANVVECFSLPARQALQHAVRTRVSYTVQGRFAIPTREH
jgi:hypothetical protein